MLQTFKSEDGGANSRGLGDSFENRFGTYFENLGHGSFETFGTLKTLKLETLNL